MGRFLFVLVNILSVGIFYVCCSESEMLSSTGVFEMPSITESTEIFSSTEKIEIPSSTASIDQLLSIEAVKIPSNIETVELPSSTAEIAQSSNTETIEIPSSTETADIPSSAKRTMIHSSSKTIALPSSTETTEMPSSTETTALPSTPQGSIEIPSSTETIDIPSSVKTTKIHSSTETTALPSTPQGSIEIPSSAETIEMPSRTKSIDLPSKAETIDIPSSAKTTKIHSSAETIKIPSSSETIALVSSTEPTEIPSSTETTALPSTTRGSIEMPSSAEAIDLPSSTETIKIPSSSETIALSTDTTEIPSSTWTIALPSSTGTSEIPSSTETIALPSSAEAIEIPSSTETSEIPSSTGTFALPSSTETTEIPSSTETIALPSSAETIEMPTSTDSINNVSVASTTTQPLTTTSTTTTTTTEIVQDMCPCVPREYCPQLFHMSKEDAKYLGDILKCPENGYVRCCGVSLKDIIRTTAKAPVIVVAINEMIDANPVNLSTSKQDFIEATTTIATSTTNEPIVFNEPITFQTDTENRLREEIMDEQEISNEIGNEKHVADMTLKHEDYKTSTTEVTETTTNIDNTIETIEPTEKSMKILIDSLIVVEPKVVEKSIEIAEIAETTDSTEVPTTTTETVETLEKTTETEVPEGTTITIDADESTNELFMKNDFQSNTDASTEKSDLTKAGPTTTESSTIDPITIEPTTEISAQDKVNDIKARRPKFIDNVIQIYPNEMSGIPKTKPKNMPDRSNEMHVYDDDMGMKIHIIFSTNQTTTLSPIDTKLNEIDDDEISDALNQITTSTNEEIIVTPEPSTISSAATIMKTTIALPVDEIPAITPQPKPKRRRFTPYRARPIMSLLDDDSSIVTSTPTTTTYKPVYRTHPLLVPRKLKSKLQISNKNDKANEIQMLTTEAPQLDITIEKTRKKLFNSGNRLNFLQRKASESVTTELPTTETMPVEKVIHVLNREIANTIDTEHKLMMERVRFAIKSVMVNSNFKQIPRSFSGSALNNRIETLEKMVERKINYAVNKETNQMDEIVEDTTTEKIIEENITKKPFRGHSRYFNTTNRGRARNRLTPSSNTSTTTSTSRPELAKKRILPSNNYLRRKTRPRPTTVAPQSNTSTTTEKPKRIQMARRKQSQANVHISRQSARNRNIVRIKSKNITSAAGPTIQVNSNYALRTTSAPIIFRPAAIRNAATPIITSTKTITTTAIPLRESADKSNILPFVKEEKTNTVVRRSPNFYHGQIIKNNAHRQNQLTRESVEHQTSTFIRNENDQNQQQLQKPLKPIMNKKNISHLEPEFAINGHQKPLIVGPIPDLKQITTDEVKIGLPAETQRTKFYF